MKISALALPLALLAFSSSSLAASRYYYDVQKFKAILESKEIEAKIGLSSLDGIELQGTDKVKRTISYTIRSGSGKCKTDVVLTFDEGSEPNYRVVSVGQVSCI